uniref:Uncharacterized protein n=2 Tax=Anguilla anguilla TaxID=7936 RepID=A0A0E9RUR9_ANGAN
MIFHEHSQPCLREGRDQKKNHLLASNSLNIVMIGRSVLPNERVNSFVCERFQPVLFRNYLGKGGNSPNYGGLPLTRYPRFAGHSTSKS